MSPDCASLPLLPPWRKDRLLLVRSTDAIRLCREGGYEALPVRLASAELRHLGRRDMVEVRSFLAHARVPITSLTSLGDTRLMSVLTDFVRNLELVVLREREDGAGKKDDPSAEQRRLVREIEVKSRHRLSLHGRQYRLVPDNALAALADRDRWEVVGRRDADRVLDGLTRQAAVESQPLAELLSRAHGKLSRDWRPPLSPDGIVLLRRIVVAQSVAPDLGPTLTPSQMKKLAIKTDWIEIEVKDDLGNPYTGAYRVQLPDGTFAEGSFDETGLWGDHDIDPGQCKMLLPEPEEATKPGTGPSPPDDQEQTWMSFQLVDDMGDALEGWSYKLKLADGSEQTGTTGDGETRLDKVAKGTCVLTAPNPDDGAEPASETG